MSPSYERTLSPISSSLKAAKDAKGFDDLISSAERQHRVFNLWQLGDVRRDLRPSNSFAKIASVTNGLKRASSGGSAIAMKTIAAMARVPWRPSQAKADDVRVIRNMTNSTAFPAATGPAISQYSPRSAAPRRA